ncbi:MAG: chitobiase/beta-hexosaminidase C-terminal domain-containing protein [Paramuribaculum sp.]|nr:chitobiase/beta-hexosaminidase C-terminal domain-containing protein [Paramuribaculum sp.]
MRLYLGRLLPALITIIISNITSVTAQTLPGETTVHIDFDNPDCFFTGVKEGFESHDVWSSAFTTDALSQFNRAPYKYVNAPASQMPHGKSHRKEGNFNFEDLVQDSTISPIAQIKQGDVTLNLDWRYCSNVISYKNRIENNFPCRLSDADVKIGASGYPAYCLYDLETGKNTRRTEGERYIYWQSYAAITVTVPEGYIITKIEFAPLIYGSIQGTYSQNLNNITFRDAPKSSSTTSTDFGSIVGTKEVFGHEAGWRDDYYAAVRWLPEDSRLRSVTMYMNNGGAMLITSRSLAVSYAKDPGYVAPTEPTAAPVLSFTNGCKAYSGSFLNSTVITIDCEDTDAQIYYTTDSSDPTDETNLARIRAVPPVTLRRTTAIDILYASRSEGKRYSKVSRTKLTPLEVETPSYISAVQRDDYNTNPAIPVVFNSALHIMDSGQNGSSYWLTLCDGIAPFTSLELRSDTPFPEGFAPGKAILGIPMMLRRENISTVYGDATPFVNDLYSSDYITEGILKLKDADTAPTRLERNRIVRYTLTTVTDGRIVFPDSTSVRITPQPGRELPEFHPAQQNRIIGVTDTDGEEPVVRLIELIRCPAMVQFSVNGFTAHGSYAYFADNELVAYLVNPDAETDYLVVESDADEGSRWGHDKQLIIRRSVNLEIYAILNNIAVTRRVYFRKITPSGSGTLDNLFTSTLADGSIFKITEPVTVRELHGDYAIVNDTEGKLHLIRSTDSWGGNTPAPGDAVTSFCTIASTTPQGSDCADITRYATTLAPASPVAALEADTLPASSLVENPLPVSVPVIITDAIVEDNRVDGADFTLDYTLLAAKPQRASLAPAGANLRYNFEGFLTNSGTFIVTSLTALPRCEPPVIAISPGISDTDFLTSTRLTISSNEDAVIKYTLDGTNPFATADALTFSRPLRIESDITVTAAALRPGYSPSDCITASFHRITTETSTLASLKAATDKTVLFTGTIQVIASTAHYLIVKDSNNTRDFIYCPDGWGDEPPAVGSTLTGFIVRNDKGIITADTYKSTFRPNGAGGAEAPAIIPPSSLPSFTLHRYVTVRGRFTDARTFEGTPIVHGELAQPENYPEDTQGRTYVLTALLTSTIDHQRCLMPVSIRDVSGKAPIITADCGDSQFWPSATITVSHPSPGATIFYRTDSDKWHRYSEPFEVSATATIEAYADEADFERNYATPLTVTRMEQCGQVAISETYAADGTATVSLAADESGTIRYTFDGTNPYTSSTVRIYTRPFELKVTAKIRAYLSAPGKADGPEAASVIPVTLIVDAITAPDATNSDISVENGRITAPEGTRIYDISGRLLPSDAILPRGIYIIILPDSTRRKVLIP